MLYPITLGLPRFRRRLSVLLLVFAVPARAQSPDTLRLFSSRDLASLRWDANGFLSNPRWLGLAGSKPPIIDELCRFRAATGHLERRTLFTTSVRKYACLSREERQIVTLNEAIPTLGLGAVCVTGTKTGIVRGHINWFPVTVTGRLRWNAFSRGVADHDWNIDLIPPDSGALTRMNKTFREYGGRGAYHIESYFDETLERIPDHGGSFWQALKAALMDKRAAKALVDDRIGVATGLYGVDAVHGYHAELHPVFALAVLIDVVPDSDSVREQWAVMLRNLGSEGDCAEGALPLFTSDAADTIQTFLIDLGTAPGGEPTVTLGPSWLSDQRFLPTARYAGGSPDGANHLYLEFTHPRPRPAAPDYLFLGTFFVQWTTTDAANWLERFALWQPPAGVPIKTDSLPDEFAAVALERLARLKKSLRAVRAGNPGEKFLDSIAPEMLARSAELRYTNSRQLISWPTSVRAERTPAWQHADSVGAGCTGAQRADPMCRGGERLIIGYGPARDASWPLVGFYLYPHSVYSEGAGLLKTVARHIFLVGNRLELRREDYRRITEDDGEGTRQIHPRRRGYTARWTLHLSPSTLRLSERIVAQPYTLAGIGPSWVREDRVRTALTWGVGAQIRLFRPEFYAEAQYPKRFGGFQSHWIYSVGWYLPRPFF